MKLIATITLSWISRVALAAVASGSILMGCVDTEPPGANSVDASPSGERQLISVVHDGVDAMLGEQECTEPGQGCTGRLRNLAEGQRVDICFAARRPRDAAQSQICLTGLAPVGASGVVDLFRCQHDPDEPPDCGRTDFWGASEWIEPGLQVVYSVDIEPRFSGCRYLWMQQRGIYCGENGNGAGHIWSVVGEAAPYCDGGAGLNIASPVGERHPFDVCGASVEIYGKLVPLL